MQAWFEGIARWIRQGPNGRRPAHEHDASDRGEEREYEFRLTAWPDLPPTLRNVHVYRALSLMSTRTVSARWLTSRAGLTGMDAARLIRVLREEEALQIIEIPRRP
jgi:hypothetical protein